MRDAVTTLIKSYDDTGRYLDRSALESIKSYFDTGLDRVKAATMISATASSIVKEAGSKLFEQVPELIRPGGNAYTTVAMRPACAIWTTTCATAAMLWWLVIPICLTSGYSLVCGKLTIPSGFPSLLR